MIRRFLAYGKQFYLMSRPLDESGEAVKTPTIELLLPIKLFWELEEMLKQVDYMTATNEDPVVLNDWQRKILKKVVSYCVTEKDRAAINELLRNATT